MASTASPDSLCVMCASPAARRDAGAAMAIATAHASGMASECAGQGARPAGFVLAVLIRALPGPRYRGSIPRLMPCRSTPAHGAPAANAMGLSPVGAARRGAASLHGTITAPWRSRPSRGPMATTGTRPLPPAPRGQVASTALPVLRIGMRCATRPSRRTRRARRQGTRGSPAARAAGRSRRTRALRPLLCGGAPPARRPSRPWAS